MEPPTDVVWKKFTSSKGKEYEVGYSAQTQPNDLRLVDVQAKNGGSVGLRVRASDSRPFGIAVHWPVGPGQWVDTTSAVRDVTRIYSYTLHKYGGTVWSYMLQFANEKTRYDYYFYDETGDSYQVNTWLIGTHWVRYNSHKPTINYVRGE
ncbi:hypothetical protein GSI_04823 [Ganoderma sinense ZZ0214-1]|uniref:Uncharacterized protein n=1 Tax=Ganoderma sinense ZZ0214-1 TaxID=1077348 RepID=A0A2G8SGL7_9APHY|nr:hypothetical protein GSI_04823 [Ganoderma sinense ZZ0214-1]